MIWVIGGTSEAREFVKGYQFKERIVATVATEDGKLLLKGVRVVVGRLEYDEMVLFIKKEGIGAVVDLSHPYAREVSSNAQKAAREMGIRYLRYNRARTVDLKGVVLVDSFEECHDLIKEIKGTIFFTSGVKNLEKFENIKGENRFIHRIIPSAESLAICHGNNVELKDIVAALGPFSKDLNKAMFAEYGADYVVMKDSGARGGTMEKLIACRELGIVPIVVSRDDFKGCSSLEDLIEEVKKL